MENSNILVEKLILFGSYANGDQHEGSDIDVAVVSSTFQGKSYWERIDTLSRAIYELFEPIEAVAFTPDEWANADTISRLKNELGKLSCKIFLFHLARNP